MRRGVTLLLLMSSSIVLSDWYNQGVSSVKRPIHRFVHQQSKAKKTTNSPKSEDDDFFQEYRRLNETNKYLKVLRKRLPLITKVFSIGKSIEGRRLKVIRVGFNYKPCIWIDGGTHAREWISTATVTFIASKVVEEFRNKDSFVSHFCWYILPVFNPDGYEYSHTKDRMWRKNRNMENETCPGVDLNRNWDYHWNESGSNKDACSDQYAGETPFSEPESRAVANFLLKKIKTQKLIAFLSFHSFGQAWLYPWGWTKKNPNDFHDLATVAIKASKALSTVNNATYEVVQTSKFLGGPSGGSSADWAKGVASIKYSYSIELPDTGRYGFLLPKEYILPVGKETWEGIKELIAVIKA